jgi:pimeloyl-ACP methyl ester carboxylesterase
MSQAIAKTVKWPIEYRLEGHGPTAMVLNGGHCSRETRLSHERLAEHGFSVLTPSRPGYDSTPSEVGTTAQEAADALAALMDFLQIPIAHVIGISAAGPTALAFALRHPDRIRGLVLESAVTTPWPEDRTVARGARLLFGRAERITWGVIKLALRLAPMVTMRTMLRGMTTLDPGDVIRRMSPEDLRFVRRLIETSRSGTGFMNDLAHRVDDLSGVTAPVLAMYSPYDRSVPPKNAQRVASEVAACELYEVPADSHLIWIGNSAKDVWKKRLSFMRA